MIQHHGGITKYSMTTISTWAWAMFSEGGPNCRPKMKSAVPKWNVSEFDTREQFSQGMRIETVASALSDTRDGRIFLFQAI